MRGIQSKRLQQQARDERAGEKGVTERDLVQKKTGSVVNSPFTIRAMYLQLKRQFKFLASFDRSAKELKETVKRMAGSAVAAVKGVRRKQPKAAPQWPDRIARVDSPLMLILQHCQPELKEDPITGETYAMPHPTYRKARLLADRGDGVAIKRLAAQFA